MSSTSDAFRDAVGQLGFVGDLVGGVRLGQYAYTVGGQVVKVGTQGARVKVRVALVTDTGDHAHRSSAYGEASRPKLGDEVWIYRERVFKVDALFVEEENP